MAFVAAEAEAVVDAVVGAAHSIDEISFRCAHAASLLWVLKVRWSKVSILVLVFFTFHGANR